MPAAARGGWWGAILGIGLVLVCATSRAAAPQTLHFDQFGVEQGLAQENVTAILQDRQGFLWLGSQAGLSRYDGYRVIVFQNRPNDPESLSDNWVTALHEDGAGRLWVGTRGGGVMRYDATRMAFQRFAAHEPESRGNGNLQIRAIIGEPKNAGSETDHIWIATADGLQRLDTKRGTFEIWHHDPDRADSLVSDDIKALVHDREGRLWIGTGAGLDRLVAQGGAFEHFRIDTSVQPDPKQNTVLALRVDAHDGLWIGTSVGLEAWNLGEAAPERRHFGGGNNLSPDPVRAILEDRDGVIWVGTATGLLRWDEDSGRFVRYLHELRDLHSLIDNDIDSLFQDRSGTLWVGTHSSGASRVDLGSGGFERIVGLGGDKGSREADKVFGIAVDREGHAWLGTIGGGLLRMDRRSGQVTVFRHDPADPHSLPNNLVRAVCVDAQGQVWVGTDTGLARFDPSNQRFRIRHLADDNPSLDSIWTIRSSRSGALWIGTDGGLHRYDPASDSLRTFRHDAKDPGSLSQGRINSLLEDREGTLWIGATTGLDRWDAGSGRFNHFRHDPTDPQSLSHDRVSDLFEDRAGQLWIGTGGGLNRMQSQGDGTLRFHAYTMKDGLSADPVGAILQDSLGRLWISSTAGISRFDPASGQFRNYRARDGLLDGSYYIGAGYAAYDGVFYFGGTSGLTAFRPEAIRENLVPPPVVITELQIFNRPVLGAERPDGVRFDGTIDATRSLRLSHENSVFSLEFAALHYADPLRNRYAYRLVGFDPGWIETDASRRFVTYTNLDPGHYVFRVKAANKDGVWNETGTSLDITIEPPYWATWWFRTLAAIALVGGLWALFRYRVRGLTRQRVLLEQKVTEHTAEVVRQKEDIEQAHSTLSVLGEIGREITATLDEAAIFSTLDRHVHGLLDATTFGIYLLDADGQGLTSALHVEGGETLPVVHVTLDSPTRNTARCARERCELHIEIEPEEIDPNHNPGTLRSMSMLFAPLAIGDRLLGVMTIQSPREHVYGERERLVFRTLCAYGAIALDNAAAYRRLAETDETLQRTLREQQAIYDNAAAAIFFIKGRKIHRCNRAMEEMLGFEPGGLVGQSTEVYHPTHESWEAQGRQVYPLISTGKVAEGEWEIMRRNGERFWIAFRGRALDPQDVSQGSIWVASDITERKHSETALLEAKEGLERSLAEVEQLNRRVSLLGELTGFLQACPSAAEAFACIGDFGPRLFPDSTGVLYLVEENADTWIEHGRWISARSTASVPAQSFPGNECWALRRSRSYRVDAPSGALCCPHVQARDGRHSPYACLPLTAQGKTFGLLYIEHHQTQSGAEADRRHGLAVAMAEQIALAIANVQLREALLQQSIRDPLTGLYNRRFLQESLFREMAHSKRNQTAFAVLMLDVDHFKKFNDTFGHHAGDVVLQNVARTIEARFRRSDIACRFGGEEFTVLLPGTSVELAQRLANDVLDGIRDLVLSHENKPLDRITASLGVAMFPDHGSTPQALIEAADAALYQAKVAGRNRVVLCGSSEN